MIINGSYFVGEIYLSQVAPEQASRVANNKVKNAYFIDEYERDILEKGLGYGLMKEFYTHINPNTGDIKESSTGTKWDRLLNGEDYSKNDCDFNWPGLVIKQGIVHRSLMAYYIYFMYKTNDASKETLRGSVTGSKSEDKVSVIPKTVGAWRKMIAWYGSDCHSYHPRVSRHNNVVFKDYFYNQSQSGKVSLYQYMSHHKDDFPNWKFTPLENLNRFDV